MKEELQLAVLEENGIPTKDMLQGLLMSIESNNNVKKSIYEVNIIYFKWQTI